MHIEGAVASGLISGVIEAQLKQAPTVSGSAIGAQETQYEHARVTRQQPHNRLRPSNETLPIAPHTSSRDYALTLPRVPQSAGLAAQVPLLTILSSLPSLSYSPSSHLRPPRSACASFSLFTTSLYCLPVPTRLHCKRSTPQPLAAMRYDLMEMS